MSVKPILFSGPMVRALLDGTKTQTRRVIKPQPPETVTSAGRYGSSQAVGYWKNEWSWLSGDPSDIDTVSFEDDFKTPFHEGDLLWVRESWFWTTANKWTDLPHTMAPTGGAHFGKRTIYDDQAVFYQASFDRSGKPSLKPSIHMPRWASRITLEVTEVRVEQVQAISEADSAQEGVFDASMDGSERWDCGVEGCYSDHIKPSDAFRCLWNSLNSKRGLGWNANPWVAAYTFTLHKQNIDELLKERAT